MREAMPFQNEPLPLLEGAGDGSEAIDSPHSEFQLSIAENLPRVPKDRSEALRQALRERAKKDLYFLAKTILGYDKMNPRTHGALCAFLQKTRGKYTRRMLLMPRSTFKTTIATISDTISRIINDPEVSILIVGDTAQNAERFLLEIKQHFERNELFRWLFSELIPDNLNKARWKTTEFEVNRRSVSREPTVDTIGALGGIESRHYHVIKADDLITERAIKSDTVMSDIINWSRGLESLLTEIGDHIDFVGSHKKVGDLYSDLKKFFGGHGEEKEIGPYAVLKGELAIFSRDILEDGESIFPERIPKRFLVRLREHDPERYYAQYANSPRGTGLNRFSLAHLRYFHLDEGNLIVADADQPRQFTISPWQLDRIVLVDPSRAEKKSSSKNAIIVVGKGSGPFRFVLETRIGHYQPDEMVDYLFEIDEKWKPTFFSIEHRGYQGAIKFWLNERADRDGLPYLPVVEYPPAGSPRAQWAKDECIKGLQPLTRRGFLWVQREQMELLEEFEFYPNIQWNDGLDCLAQGLEYWPSSSDEREEILKREREDDFLLGAGLGRSLPLLLLDDARPFDEQAFLSSLGPTGYGVKTFDYRTRGFDG
ncbi:MAG: hypothetical protein J5I35_03960 [Methanothrix harundinacea]|nr:hypothetical protein [Methanothrix harundinacea]